MGTDLRCLKVESDHLKLETTREEPRQFLQTMYELIWLRVPH
jgi:hypothetical protein